MKLGGGGKAESSLSRTRGQKGRTYLLALVVVAQQRVGQGAEGGKQDPVGDAEGQNHTEVPGQGGEPGPQSKGQICDEVQGADTEIFFQLLQNSCRPDRGLRTPHPLGLPGTPSLGPLPRADPKAGTSVSGSLPWTRQPAWGPQGPRDP